MVKKELAIGFIVRLPAVKDYFVKGKDNCSAESVTGFSSCRHAYHFTGRSEAG
jgi:hypothetical protein